MRCLAKGQWLQGQQQVGIMTAKASAADGAVLWSQAVQAVTNFNGTELAGRKILVREDREDRDVKQYNRENGIEPQEREARPARRERRAPGQGPREDRPPRGERRESASTGLQVGSTAVLGWAVSTAVAGGKESAGWEL